MLSILPIDVDCGRVYEVYTDEKLVIYSDIKPQIITVNEDRFVVPLYYLREPKLIAPVASTDDSKWYKTKSRAICHDMLCYVSYKVKTVMNEYEAKIMFSALDIPFGEIIEVSKRNEIIKFAVADEGFLHTHPVNQIGAFMYMKSIIRIEE